MSGMRDTLSMIHLGAQLKLECGHVKLKKQITLFTKYSGGTGIG